VKHRYEYCHRDGHLVEFFFQRKMDEPHQYEWNNWIMYLPPQGMHDLLVHMSDARPRGAMPQGVRLGAKLHSVHA
jgi:hypothetical protein